MHTRAKISVTFWVVATALAASVALTINLRGRYELQVYQVTALIMLLAVVGRFWAIRRLRQQQELNADSRVTELHREVKLLDQPLRIEGMGPTLWLMIGIAITALLFIMYLGTQTIAALVFAILAAIVVLIMALMRIATWGQPLLIISREGIQPAGYGLVPWSAVFGIECHTPEKNPSGTVLNLNVPDLQQHLGSAHPLIRFFRGIPIRAAEYVDVIRIPLRKPSELPGVVERLCRNVWRDATGRTHVWTLADPISRLQLTQMIEDTDRSAQEAARSDRAREQQRMEMEILRRQAQIADEKYRSQRTWMRVWNVPGAVAIALIAGQVPFSRLVAFVPTDAWSTQALAIAVVAIAVAWALVIGHARNVFGQAFTRTRLVQVLGTLGLTSILILPLTWFLITDVGGAMATYGSNGPNEEITLIAAKEEVHSRRGCSYVLSHPGLGKQLCLVYSEFMTYPSRVPVVLSIRRNALGYTVYEQRIVLPRS